MKKILAIIVLICCGALPAYADVTIGLVGPEVGDKPVWGDTATRGAQQAVDDINAQGGVNNEKLVLRQIDDGCDVKKARAIASQFAGSGVKFVIGHACSASSIAASRVYNDNKMLMISALSMAPALTEAGYKTVFRVCGRDDEQGVAQANYVIGHYRDYRIGIIHDNSTAGQAQAEAFQKTINAVGVKEAVYNSYVPHRKDYSAMVRGFTDVNGIQLLVVEGSYSDVAAIAREIKKQKADIQIIGSDTLATQDFWDNAGKAGEGVLMTFEPDTSTLPDAQAAVASLSKAGIEPVAYTLTGYAAVQAIAQGIKLAGYPDPQKVAAALHKNTFATALGKIGFDAKGDVTGSSYAVYRWHHGTYAQVEE